ncbi:hypothetical protein SBA3_2270028 [Candidatus Sulfopaludibacter sp. SbA3]|nr:hypothetical protein SBA3_2270028 [Candidatus Sulfopaludibacter sp. SbA3]
MAYANRKGQREFEIRAVTTTLCRCISLLKKSYWLPAQGGVKRWAWGGLVKFRGSPVCFPYSARLRPPKRAENPVLTPAVLRVPQRG